MSHNKADDQFLSQVNHIATMLVVSNIDSSIEFYKNIFGFEVKRYEKNLIALLKFQNTQLYFITYSPSTPDKPDVELKTLDTKGKTPVSVVFNVKDCDKTYQMLLKRGLKFLTPPQSPPWGGKRCFALDPDGYLLEIEEGT